MQTNCPQCSQKLVVEDEKVPAGPFMLRCPKCQAALKLPGKAGAAPSPPAAPMAEAGSAAAKAAPPQPTSSSAASSTPQEAPAPAPSVTRSEEPPAGGKGRALVVLPDAPDPGLHQAVSSLLQKNGYGFDTTTDAQRGVQFLERTSYALVVTTPNGNSGPVSVYKRVVALAPEARRNLFLVLLGSEYSSGDGTQAFASMADLVLHPKDVGSSEDLLRGTVAERHRIYRAFLDAQVRLDRRKY